MADHSFPSTTGVCLDELEKLFSRGNLQDRSDWARTINNLMKLAKEAGQSYDYERAINYLCMLENIWDSKGLPEFSIELRFELHKEKGKAFASQGKYDQAIYEYQKILRLCRDSNNLSIKAETYTQIGQLLAKQGDHDRSLGYHQRAIGAYRRLNDIPGSCKALRNLGVVYVELGEFEDAENTYAEAIEAAEGMEDKMIYADLVNNLGTIMNMRGKQQRALELYRESLKIYESLNEVRKSAYTTNNMAITLAEQGQNDEALEYFESAYAIATSMKDAPLVMIVDINLADLYLKKGNIAEARKHCARAEAHLIESKLTNGHLVETKKIIGKIAFYDKNYDEAEITFNEALKISREIGAKYLEAEVLMERGILYRTMDRHFDSLTDLEASYHIYTSVKADGKREQTEEVINSIEQLYLDVFDKLAQEVDLKDKYTKGHSDRVASLALLLAKELGLRANMLKTVVAAALLHDLGKIKIEDEILNKAGKLTEDEFVVIKKHPEFGVELLRGKEFPWDIKPLVLHHHEKIDGRGYPLGLKGEDIPLGARIICVADVFDALTSDRVYRSAYDTARALQIMNEESETTFDPVILQCFVNMIGEGKADMVINSRTREDEMYSIWSQCMMDDQNPESRMQNPVTA